MTDTQPIPEKLEFEYTLTHRYLWLKPEEFEKFKGKMVRVTIKELIYEPDRA